MKLFLSLVVLCVFFGVSVITQSSRWTPYSNMKCEEEESLNDPQVYNQEGNFGLNEEGPEHPQIKEEQEEVCTSQDVVQVVVKQETEEIFVWPGDEQFRVLDDMDLKREEDLHSTGEGQDDRQICNQERSSALNQEDPDPPETKEEEEEISINEEEEQLALKQETKDDIVWTRQELGIMWNPEVKLHIIGNEEQTAEFIKLRRDNEHLFTGAKHSAAVGWRAVLEKMGVQGKITPFQAKKKWDNLKKKYKDCKYPGSGDGVSRKRTAATWPWFALMDEVLGQSPSTRPPVLIASIREDTPGPSSAVGNQVQDEKEQEREGQLEQRREKRKKDKEDELLDLIREDMRLQTEMEERRGERMDRLMGLLEKLIEK